MLFTGDVLVVFFLSVIFTTSGQLLQKKASIKYSKNSGMTVSHYLFSVDVAASICLLALGLLCWLMVLAKVELSLAYPLLSINYILILLGAKFFFNESIPTHRWAGVAIILLGISVLVRG